MEKKQFDPGNEILGCFQMVKAALMSTNADDITKIDKVDRNRLRTLALIGSGGQADVFRAVYGTTEIAVKKFKSNDELDMKRIKDMLKVKRHRNIIDLYGLCPEKPGPWLMMELARCSLYSVIHDSSEAIDSMMVLKYGLQIAEGCRHLHRADIIHRDLKSANILLGYDGQLKISDFDSHTSGGAKKATISMQGTFQWMAPELIRNERCTNSVDVWSYGIILWELLTRQAPYQDWNHQQVMWEVGNGRISTPIPSSAPPQVAAILNRCIELEPEKRMNFDEIVKTIPFAESDMRKILPNQLEQFRKQWAGEVADVLDDFLRSKATCISDRREKELIEIESLRMKIQRVHDDIMRTQSNSADHFYSMMHQLPFSFRSSVLRASMSASHTLPGLDQSVDSTLVFDSSFTRTGSSRRKSKRQKTRKSAEIENRAYISDEEEGEVSDGMRPTTVSRNLSWRPNHSSRRNEPLTTTDDSSSNHPQSSGEDTAENMFESDQLESSDFDDIVIRRQPSRLPKADEEPSDEGFVSRNTTIYLSARQKAATVERINQTKTATL